MPPHYGDYRDFQPGGDMYDPEEFRQNEIQRGNETGTYATHGGGLDEIQAALDELSKDPAVMGQLQQGHTQFVQTELAKRGLALPRHYALDIDGGRIVPREQGKWERWKTPVLLTAAMFGGGFAAEALMGAGAGGAAAGAGGASGAGGAGAGGSALTAGGLLGGADTAATVAGSTGAILGGGAGAGTTSTILGTAGKVAPILGNAAANHAAGKRFDEQTQLNRDQVALNSYNSGLTAPSKRLRTSQDASILKNWTPVTSSGSGRDLTFSGGYNNPNLIDPRSKQLADDVIAQQLEQQLAGGGIDRGGPPKIAPHPKSSAWDKILGGAATGASILGAF